MPFYSDSLMIGATGMLIYAAAWVAERSERMVLVSRNAPVMSLANHSNVVALAADWCDTDEFFHTVAHSDGFKNTQLAVLWMHSDGAQAKRRVLEALSALDCLVVDVLGSNELTELAAPSEASSQCGNGAHRITVRLGAMQTATGRRWLTWEEISRGIIDAIQSGESRIVGTLP